MFKILNVWMKSRDRSTVSYNVHNPEEVNFLSFPRMDKIIPDCVLNEMEDPLAVLLDEATQDYGDDWVKTEEPCEPKPRVEDLIQLFGGGSLHDSKSKSKPCSVAPATENEVTLEPAPEQLKDEKGEADSHGNGTDKKAETAGPEGPSPSDTAGRAGSFWNRITFPFLNKNRNVPDYFKAVRGYGAKIMEAGLDIANMILSDSEDPWPCKEDNVLFNDYKILVYGNQVRLDSVRRNRNVKNQEHLEAVVKLKGKIGQPAVYFDDGFWLLDFGDFAGFVQIHAPSGVDLEEITYEGPCPEGVVIVKMPSTS